MMNESKKEHEIRFYYLSGLLLPEDIEKTKELLSQVNIRVRAIDRDGVYTANADDFTNVVSIILHAPLLVNLIEGIGPNALWDAIKVSSMQIWLKVRGEKYKKINSRREEEKSITFGIEARFDPATNYNFRFEGLTSEDQANRALDKVLDFLREESNKQTVMTTFLGKYMMRYSIGK